MADSNGSIVTPSAENANNLTAIPKVKTQKECMVLFEVCAESLVEKEAKKAAKTAKFEAKKEKQAFSDVRLVSDWVTEDYGCPSSRFKKS
jgi:hypothetical protein